MNNRAFTISFIIALLAVSMVYSYVASTEDTFKERFGAETSVVVAKKDIHELDPLDETNLTYKAMPKSFAEPGSVGKVELFTGALAASPIMAGEQVTRSKVVQAGLQSGLARQVSIGKRAITVNISDESGVAKLLKPGDRVDVIANLDLSAGNKMLTEVRTILQDILVLATGKYITNTLPGIMEADPYKGSNKNLVRLSEYNAYSTITLEVDPSQVQTLVFAAKNLNGVILALRNNDDNSKEEIPKTMAKDLQGGGIGPQRAGASGAVGTPQPRIPGGR